MRCHPGRWLWGLIPVAMLSWLAVQVERPTIEADLERRSGEALAASGHDWAVVAFDGRDGLLAGEPGNEQQRHEALALVRSVWGVRVVRTRTGATTTIMDVPITPASEPPPPDQPLGDQAPEAVVSHLPPATTSSAAAILLAEVAPATPTESLQAREEHAASAPPLTSEASASAIAAPSVEQPAPELPAPKTALAPAATSAEHTSVPPSMPSEAQAVPADAADVPPPEPKQAAPSALAAKRVPDVVAAAVTQESATLPPKPDAEAARIAARVDLPSASRRWRRHRPSRALPALATRLMRVSRRLLRPRRRPRDALRPLRCRQATSAPSTPVWMTCGAPRDAWSCTSRAAMRGWTAPEKR